MVSSEFGKEIREGWFSSFHERGILSPHEESNLAPSRIVKIQAFTDPRHDQG